MKYSDLRRSTPEGSETGGPAGGTADQIRTGHQFEDRQDARPHYSADAAYQRRRGDRIEKLLAAVRWSLVAHSVNSRLCLERLLLQA
jgi:hypothetical protein